MGKDSTFFVNAILELRPPRTGGYCEYGSRVMPVLELYRDITETNERLAFQEALERLLCDSDETIRTFAVDVCLGFFVLRDAI